MMEKIYEEIEPIEDDVFCPRYGHTTKTVGHVECCGYDTGLRGEYDKVEVEQDASGRWILHTEKTIEED